MKKIRIKLKNLKNLLPQKQNFRRRTLNGVYVKWTSAFARLVTKLQQSKKNFPPAAACVKDNKEIKRKKLQTVTKMREQDNSDAKMLRC